MNSKTISDPLVVPSMLVLPLVMEEWLSSSAFPALICDVQQRILWHSANLAEFLDEMTCMKIERDCLILGDKRAQAALSRFLLSSELPTAVIAADAQHEPKQYMLHCRRLTVRSYVTAFGLRILSDDGYRESAVLHFDDYYDLTRQETLICRDLLRGKTVQEIVKSRKKSPETVRFHIRNIYQKLEVCSREALLAKLRLFLFE